MGKELRKALELVSGLNQPGEDGIRVDLKEPGHGANPEPFSQSSDSQDQPLRADVLAMKERAMRFEEIAATTDAMQLTPGSAAGMAVGAEIAKPCPAPVGTAGLRTTVRRGVD